MADKRQPITDPQSDNARLVISNKHKEAIFPPSIADLEASGAGSSNEDTISRAKSSPQNTGLGNSEFSDSDRPFSPTDDLQDDDLSVDLLSIRDDHQRNRLAISCRKKESDLKTLTSCLYQEPQVEKTYDAEQEGSLPYQQASYAHENSSARPHTPEDDSSPHESMEQGNSTCYAPSRSSCEQQMEYWREESYEYAEMVDVIARHETFAEQQWPLDSPTPEQLASANMFYQGNVD